MEYVIYQLLSLGIPLLSGAVVGSLAGGSRRSPFEHAIFCMVAMVASILAGYAGFLVFSSAVTGNWPTEISLAGLGYALGWFAIVALFTSVPLTFAGYALGILVRRSPSQQV